MPSSAREGCARGQCKVPKDNCVACCLFCSNRMCEPCILWAVSRNLLVAHARCLVVAGRFDVLTASLSDVGETLVMLGYAPSDPSALTSTRYCAWFPSHATSTSTSPSPSTSTPQ